MIVWDLGNRVDGGGASTPSSRWSGRWTRAARRPSRSTSTSSATRTSSSASPPRSDPTSGLTTHPGWDRTWQEDLAWLGSYDQPVVLDEYAPLFAPCLRGPGEGYGLAIDRGSATTGVPATSRSWRRRCRTTESSEGSIWGGFGEVFAIPLDLTVGEGPWAHLPASDYVRTRDHYPAEPGVFRRGDGDWGLFDAWNRPRPELWHVHEMYSPIGVSAADFAEAGRPARPDAGQPVLAPLVRGARGVRDGRRRPTTARTG